MPLVEITAPAGVLSEPALESLQTKVAKSVLTWMGLPDDDFFAGATWVYVNEARRGWSGTGAAGVRPGFMVVVTALEKFFTPADTESLSAELTGILREAAGPGEQGPESVWVVVNEVPEGYWGINGGLTRRAKIDELVARSAG